MRKKIITILLAIGLATAAFAQEKNIFPDSINLDGKTENLSRVKGKLTVINFWAVWCKPCKYEIPQLNELYKKYHEKGVEFIAVSISKEKEKIDKFLEKTPINYSIWIDDTEKLSDQFRVSVMPTTILLDENHNILYEIKGFSKEKIQKMDSLILEKLQK